MPLGRRIVLAEPVPLEGRKILIVDDELDVLDTLESLLPMCEVVRASTFEEAWKLLETQNFDVAVLDIMGVDGYQLLEKATQKNIMTVMLTAHALNVESTVRSFRKGAAYYLPKDEMPNIAAHLSEILRAAAKGENLWARWLERFDRYYEKKFGPDWKQGDREFWDKFQYPT
jgi:DNA-binding response OmpR family regulator